MTAFPSNVVDVLHTSLESHLQVDGYAIINRAVRPGDPNLTVGIVSEDWAPIEGSEQIGQIEPALGRYRFSIQNLVISPDEQLGREFFSSAAKMIKVILYRDITLQLALSELEEELLTTVERFKRSGVTRQRYVSGQLSGIWNFVATTSFWIETEVTQL